MGRVGGEKVKGMDKGKFILLESLVHMTRGGGLVARPCTSAPFAEVELANHHGRLLCDFA